MRNEYVIATMLAAIMVFSVVVFAPAAMAGNNGNGNGAPSGAHYNLNLIGKDKTDILPNDANNGHRIFVNLKGKSKINLQEGDFAVIDADATDGKGIFQLPKPENTVVTDPVTGEVTSFEPGAYTVWIRAVGTPGGSGTLETCATDPDLIAADATADGYVCSEYNVILARDKGKQTFGDVTQELTTVTYYDSLLDKYITVDIFDEQLEGYLWEFNNNGLKVVQLRFYPN